jgi:hypothetical protein
VASGALLGVPLALGLSLAAQRSRPPDTPSDGLAARRDVMTEPEDRSPGVFTYHNDWARTGQNLAETLLTPRTVTPARFGRFDTHLAVDGLVYAQPLYAPDISTDTGTFNLVIVATEHNSVYAFDADVDQHPAHASSPIWHRNLTPEGSTPSPSSDNTGEFGACLAVSPEVGITSTPVIDPASRTIYVVAKSKDAAGQTTYRLHALDLATGLDQASLGSPVVIDAAVAGRGSRELPEPSGTVRFDALRANQRAGLALVNGIVYIGFASYCDYLPYHGWLLGYDTRDRLAQVVVFNTSPNGVYGGIWNGGAAPAIDATGTMYLQVGNGPYEPEAHNWGDTILALPVDRPTVVDRKGFRVLDYFEPFNPQFLIDNDLDLGSGGMLLLPDRAGTHPHLMVGGSKQGLVYVVDRDKFTTDDVHHATCTREELAGRAAARASTNARVWSDTCDPVLQVFKNVTAADKDDRLADVYRGHGLFSTPSYFGGHVYLAGANDRLKMFEVVDGGLVNEPSSMSSATFPFPGVTASISANGERDAIVWVVDARQTSFQPAVLYAFDATDLSRVLYKNSGDADDQRAGIAPVTSADAMSVGIRFSVPAVYGGKVFVVTQGALNIFGLRR